MMIGTEDLKLGDAFRWTGEDIYTIISQPARETDSFSGRAKIRFRIFHPRFLKTYPMVIFPEEKVWLIE